MSDVCGDLRALLPDYIEGEAEAEVCEAIEQHLHDCEGCRVVVDTLKRTISLYRELPPDPLPRAVRRRLYTRLNLDDFL